MIWSSNLARCSLKNLTAKYQLLSNSFFFPTKTISKTAVADPGGGGGQFLGQTEARRAEKFFGDRLRPPPTLFKGSGWLPPPLISRFGSGPEYPWIAIIKTKSATIAFLSSPPVRFSLLFLLFFFLFLRWCRDYRAYQAQKPTLWPFFNQMAVTIR